MPPLNIRDLLLDRVGVPLTSRRDTLLIVSGVDGFDIVRGNPSRVGLAITNGGTGTMWVAPLRIPADGEGFRVEASGGALLLNWEEDGEVVAWPWFGRTPAGTTLLFTLQQLMDAAAPRLGTKGD